MNDKNLNEIDQRIYQIAQEDPHFAAMQLRRIAAMARINLTPFDPEEIEAIVIALGGVNLRPLDQMPWEELPLLLAGRISDARLSAHIANFDPFEAYLLLVCAELAAINRGHGKDLKDDAFFPVLDRDQT